MRNGIFPAISVNNESVISDYSPPVWAPEPSGHSRRRRILSIWQQSDCSHSLGWVLRKGSLGCENRKLALDSWSAYPSNDFSESRFVHLPVHQFSSVAQSCPTICNPMDCSTPGLPVHHQLLEFTQTDVHRVGDAIQPSHPLLSPSPPAFNLSHHHHLFKWVSSSHQNIRVSASISVLPMNTQDWFPLGWTGWISLKSKGLMFLVI